MCNTENRGSESATEDWKKKYQSSMYGICPYDYKSEEEYLVALSEEKARVAMLDGEEDELDASEIYTGQPDAEGIEKAISKIYSDSLIFDLAENYDQNEKVSVVKGDLVSLVSVQNLLIYTTKFAGKEIKLKQEIATQSGNNPKRKSIYCYRIKSSDEGFGVDYSKSIEVFYDKLPDVKRLVMLNFPASHAITVKGKVLKYTNSDDVYIQATEIGGIDELLEKIQEPESPLSRYAELRQIVAFPSTYENKPYALRGDLVVFENHPERETLVLCESTGVRQNEFNENVKIEVSYKTCSNHDMLLALKANHQKVKVRGYVGVAEDKSAFMVGRVINIINNFIPKVSIKMLLAFPERYIGQVVRIEEQVAISANDVKRKSFKTFQSTGNARHEWNGDNRIEVFYRNLSYAEKCIMVDSNYQKISVEGQVCKYNNNNEIYIEGTEILGDCIK